MSGPNAYPLGGVHALLATGFVTGPTRSALQTKLDLTYPAPAFFDRKSYGLLRALCDRLIPRDAPDVDIAGALDRRLADGKRNGWRYDVLPPDGEAFRRGLEGVDQTARTLFGEGFTTLDGARQDQVITAVQEGAPAGAVWAELPAARWFEELLVEVTEIHFAHPLAQQAMGYLGMADARGWTAIGLDEDEPEPHVAP